MSIFLKAKCDKCGQQATYRIKDEINRSFTCTCPCHR